VPGTAADYYRAKRETDGDPRLQRSPRRIHDLIRAAIRSGELRKGDKLDELSLIRRLSSSRNAVREALQLLTEEGLLTRSPREGTTVVAAVIEMPLDNLIAEGLADEIAVERLSDERVPSTPSIRHKLQTQAAEVGAIEHLFTFHGEPVGVLTNYYHADVVQPTGWVGCPDLPTVFEQVHGVVVGWVDTTIEAQLCEPRTTRILGLTERLPVLVREQIIYDVDGRPHSLAYSHFRTDRVTFNVRSTPITIPHQATLQQSA
jgi:GntR family transcriptional regulator